MSFFRFLEDKIISMVIFTFATLFITMLLIITKTNTYITFFIAFTLALSGVVSLLFEYFRKYSFYKNLIKCTETLDKTYLLSEVIDCPRFLEGEFLYTTLKISNKAMNDQIAVYRLAMEEYREYIETWVHEIKTPISSSMLIVENNPSDTTKKLQEEITKISGFVEQALFYSRSNTVEKDYIIKEYRLNDIVKSSVKQNSKMLIENKISVDIKDFQDTVFTDGKWIDFILNQLISNAIKYKSESSFIRFYSSQNANSVSLFIEDNGIGIPEKDISRVFQKGFTGENGRKFSKSTGLGLYLCKKLCNKLGLDIQIASKIGTTVEIIFPMGNLTIL